MKQKTIIGEHGSVHYWVGGQGEPCVVFTHGATMDHGLFEHQIDYFAPNYKLIVWDVPKHGRSRPYEQFSLKNAADALVGILDDEKVEKAHLVGQSMGGYISQIMARDYPERVKSLVAVDSSPMQPSYYSALDKWLLSITSPLLRLYPYNSLIKAIAKQIAVQASAQKYALETLKQLSKTEIADIMGAVYEGVIEFGQEERLPVPILIIYGEADRTGKVRTYSKQWAEREKRPLQIIPNAAHNANMDNPDAFNRILEAFLQQVEQGELLA
ncbi:alpha/beta fold hydrolase [Candidatus Leptofilum sp.]|uniref:alpha/beta fold hydrolase n=1 Tax=Candidatus Leptofilum sp. TaxID=3241576 RepID=UPI003B59AD81